MNRNLPILVAVTFCAALPPAANADIYKCTDEHGNVAYLQLPCPVKRLEAVNKDDHALVEKQEDVAEQLTEPQRPPSSREPDELLADCKKRFRDQIDEIDAEMHRDYSTEKSAAYKARLLALTQQLRACG